MTLILGMSKADGVHLSVDYRITSETTAPGRPATLIDDETVKHLTVHYPPSPDGPRVLLAYTGIAHLPDRSRTPVGDWLRETLRGESEVIDVSMQHLKARLDRDFARRRKPLIINGLAIEGPRRILIEFANCEVSATSNTLEIVDSFRYTAKELTEPMVIANGSAVGLVVAGKHRKLLASQLNVRPRDTRDHMKLLASVNRRIAAADPEERVSPHCHVSFIGETDAPVSQVFIERGKSMPFRMPVISSGADISFFAEQFMAGTDLSSISPDEWNRNLKRRN